MFIGSLIGLIGISFSSPIRKHIIDGIKTIGLGVGSNVVYNDGKELYEKIKKDIKNKIKRFN